MNIILFDGEERKSLLPLTYTRPVSELRVGILTISEKWEIALNKKISFYTENYLSKKYMLNIDEDNLLINGSVMPNEIIINLLKNLNDNEALLWKGYLLAARMDREHVDTLIERRDFDDFIGIKVSDDKEILKINHLWDIFQMTGFQLEYDYKQITNRKNSISLSQTNTLIGDGDIFISKGAKIEGANINTEKGPIYIDENAEIMEGTMIRGPFYLGKNSVVKMGAKIYGATSVGNDCKVGGEINNSVFQAYSNKAHDGFLGNSVIGEWCNIGADTNNSNLKNNYTEVKIWNYEKGKFINTGTRFCGLFMGDHSKTGINTMFNTGTVTGVSANIFGSGFPRTFIPSFAWGGNHGFNTFNLDKVFETASAMMNRRGLNLTETDIKILMQIYADSAKYRAWEN